MSVALFIESAPVWLFAEDKPRNSLKQCNSVVISFQLALEKYKKEIIICPLLPQLARAWCTHGVE